VYDGLFAPVVFGPIAREDLNARLVAWGHKMGEVRRPTRGWSHGLHRDGQLLAVVSTDTLIRERVAGFSRVEAVELSRLCAVQPGLCRVMLRLWRMFVFPDLCADRGYRWAVSYQDSALHRGDLYRFDGWVRIGTSRSGTDSRSGRRGRQKVIWGWNEDPDARRRRSLGFPEAPGCLVTTIDGGRGEDFPFLIGNI
jgi:antitoxin VapB